MKFKMMKHLFIKKSNKNYDEKKDDEEKELLINNINEKKNNVKNIDNIDITGGSILSRNKYKDKKRIKLNI